MHTEARQRELQKIAEGWSGLGVLLSPLPYVGETISDFCHRRAGKFYMAAFGPLTEEAFVRITALLEGFMEMRRS